MTTPTHDHAAALLAAPDSTAAELWEAARGLRDAFVRGDHLIGLLPGDASDTLIAALERAGTEGEVAAWVELGRLLVYGAAPHVPYPPRDIDAAIDAYRRADAAGSRDGAVGWIRVAYFTRDAERAEAAAARLDRLVAEVPHDGEVLLFKGYLTHQGYGYEHDPAAGAAWHRQAADLGNAAAAFELSVLHTTGDGLPVDEAEARRWTHRAAELGSARAMANLGSMYATASGVERDGRAALDWYVKAAEAGHETAAFKAGVMCLIGDAGLPVDVKRAAELFELAEESDIDVDEELEFMGLSRP